MVRGIQKDDDIEEVLPVVTEALLDWMELQPKPKRACCQRTHFTIRGSVLWEPMPDDDICERELAWRKYVRLRDGNPNWPFSN